MAEETANKAVQTEVTRTYLPPSDLVENSNVMQWMKKKGFQTEKEMRSWTSTSGLK